MSDLRLNSEGDLDITQGKLTLIDTQQELLKQKLTITLNTYRGEWFLNTQRGIPYLQVILKKGTPKALVDSIFYQTILSYEDILNITEFNSSVTKGVYYLSFKATVVSGEIITLEQDMIIA